MKRLWVIGALLVTGSFLVHAQDAARPVLRVGERVFTTRDFEHVKTLLPFERFKTSLGQSRLIDAIYVEFLIAKAKLEAAGLPAITAEEVELQVKQFETSSADLNASGYTPSAFTERTLIATKVKNFLFARAAATRSGNAWFAPQTTGTPEDPDAARERRITSQVTLRPLPVFYGRTMLLENARVADALSRKIGSEADFIAAARRFSLVRREVAGAYSSNNVGVSVTQLEPELQIALLSTSMVKTGLLRVAAPFGRVWLVYRAPPPKLQTQASLSYFVNLTAPTAIPVLFGVDSFDPRALIDFLSEHFLNESTVSVEFLDRSLEPRNPVIAEVGGARFHLTDYFVARLLGEVNPRLDDAFFAAGSGSPLASFVSPWLEGRSIAVALPYNGAGAEVGLAPYIAARAKVSELQLKYAYWQNRDEYLYRLDERTVLCEFDTADLARKWRDTVLLAPFEIWADFSRNAVGVRCDRNPQTMSPLLLPSKITLTPVAGGFVTGIAKSKDKFSFVLRYGFHPDRIRRPFLIVRDIVERKYRKLVGLKRLEMFKAELLERANAKNLLAEAVAELEQP